jgi:hypothetical protein
MQIQGFAGIPLDIAVVRLDGQLDPIALLPGHHSHRPPEPAVQAERHPHRPVEDLLVAVAETHAGYGPQVIRAGDVNRSALCHADHPRREH